MNKHTYGDRHATHLIEDVRTSPRVASPAATERTGKAKFLPFEEIGGSLNLKSQLPKKLTRPIHVEDKDVPTKIGVSKLAAATNDYTFVPPLQSLRANTVLVGVSSSPAAITKFDHYLSNLFSQSWQSLQTGVKDLSSAARDFYEFIVVRPLLAAGAFVKRGMYKQNYSVTDGLQELSKIKRATLVKATAGFVVAAASLLLFTQLLHDPSASNGDNGKSTGNSISVSDRRPDNSSNNGKSNGTNAKGNSTSTSNTKPNTTASTGTASASANPVSGGTAGTSNGSTGYPAGSVGRGGGSSALPSTVPAGNSATAPISVPPVATPTVPDPMLAPNPADAVPYGQYTAPSSTVQTGGKQVVGTSPATLTTN